MSKAKEKLTVRQYGEPKVRIENKDEKNDCTNIVPHFLPCVKSFPENAVENLQKEIFKRYRKIDKLNQEINALGFLIDKYVEGEEI